MRSTLTAILVAAVEIIGIGFLTLFSNFAVALDGPAVPNSELPPQACRLVYYETASADIQLNQNGTATIRGLRITGDCSGTVVGPHEILTAAHCPAGIRLRGIPSGLLTVCEGGRNVQLVPENAEIFGGTFSGKNSSGDLAVVRVKADFKVQPAQLPKSERQARDLFDTNSRKNCRFFGFGGATGGPPAFGVLSGSSGKVLDTKTLKKILDASTFNPGQGVAIFGPEIGGAEGDSGGGVFCRSGTGPWILGGVFSARATQADPAGNWVGYVATFVAKLEPALGWLEGVIHPAPPTGPVLRTNFVMAEDPAPAGGAAPATGP